MVVKTNHCRKLNICMTFPLWYEPDMLIYPRIEIFSYLSHFSHKITWIISSGKTCPRKPLFLSGAEVHVVPYHHYVRNVSFLAKVINMIPHILQRMHFILTTIEKGKYDLVFVRGSGIGIFDGLVATYIKRKSKVLFVYELPNPLDQWEMIKMASPKHRSLHYLVSKFQERIGRFLLHQADLILPISTVLQDYLITNNGIPASKILTIPVGIDVRAFSSQDGKQVTAKYQLNDSKIVIYVGNLDKARMLKLLIEAFAIVRSQKLNAKLLLIGKGDDAGNLRKLTDELGMNNSVIFIGHVSRSEIPDFIAAADIGVSVVPPLPFYMFSSPIKMFEYMAMVKPVVANQEIPEHKEVIDQCGGGILVPFTAAAFAIAIIELLNNPEKSANMGKKGREWVVQNRSYDILARQVEERYLARMNETNTSRHGGK